MGFYRVNFGEYFLCHHTDTKYFDYFEHNGEKYIIGSKVELTDKGTNEMIHNGVYNYVKNDFRLVDHYVTENGNEEWTYIIGWRNYGNGVKSPVFYYTRINPDELVSNVLSMKIDEKKYAPGELKVEFKEPNYFPKDWEVEGVMAGWAVLVVVWLIALLFKDWWITLIIQIAAGFYFGNWRETQINKAISEQKFNKKSNGSTK